jgi:hypothetical protein
MRQSRAANTPLAQLENARSAHVPAQPRISLVTNVSLLDEARFRHTVPSWVRVFGERLSELVVIVDGLRPTGRIATAQGPLPDYAEFQRGLERLAQLDPRVRIVPLPEERALEPVARRWFMRGRPLRCQAGTPILAFVYALESASSPLVLRCDCDMLFFESGWLEEACARLHTQRALIVEPARLGGDHAETVSTRAMLTCPRELKRALLPMRAHRLGLARRLHRRLLGRPDWLALEQMLELERRRGRLEHVILPEALGYSVHVATRADAARPGFEHCVAGIEAGAVPAAQAGSWNFRSDAWG